VFFCAGAVIKPYLICKVKICDVVKLGNILFCFVLENVNILSEALAGDVN